MHTVNTRLNTVLTQWHAIHEVEEALLKVRAHITKLTTANTVPTNKTVTVGTKRRAAREIKIGRPGGVVGGTFGGAMTQMTTKMKTKEAKTGMKGMKQLTFSL